jgi:hypothetical protein
MCGTTQVCHASGMLEMTVDGSYFSNYIWLNTNIVLIC